MDKFLNLCFKTGKVIFSVLLVISMIVAVVMLGQTASDTIKLQDIKVTYKYDVKQIVKNEAHPEQQQKINVDTKKNELKAEKEINDFAKKQNLSEAMTLELKRVVTLIDENEQITFFENFVKFFDDYINETIAIIVKEQNADETKMREYVKQHINDIVSGSYNKFLALYDDEKEIKNAEKQKQENKRNMNFMAFLVALGIFILCLFLPILIRIEENTRK